MSTAVGIHAVHQAPVAPSAAEPPESKNLSAIDLALQRIEADGLWEEIRARNRSSGRTLRLSPALASICRSLAWPARRQSATQWFKSVTLIMWLSIPFDYLIAPYAIRTIVIGHAGLTTLALLLALLAWSRPQRHALQGASACLFVSMVMLAAAATGYHVGGADFERFVVIGFFGMVTGVALLPLSTRWTVLTTLTLNVVFMVCQFINPEVDGSSGLLFTLYCSAISGALVWMRLQTNNRQARALLSRLTEMHTSRLLEKMANTDALTGLRNRKAMIEDFAHVLATAPAGTALSVAMIDIDDFKGLNDTLGHAAGDQALRLIGSLFADISKAGSLICGRIGGEEFLVLIPSTEAESARQALEGMVRHLDRLNLPNPGSRVADRITVSIGLVTATVGKNAPCHPESLMRTADLALYEAKRTGRNRIVSLATSIA